MVSQIRVTRQPFDSESGDAELPLPTPVAQAQAQSVGLDALLDEIEDVLETNAAAFVKGFVQKGGQ